MKKISQSSFFLFFTQFLSILKGGILFSVPFAVLSGIFILAGYLTGFNNIILWGLGIIPSAPFYSGLVMVVRKISVEKKKINVTKTFFSTIKENLLKSLFNGFITYLIVACSFFAILYYSSLAKTDIVFGAILILYIIFTVALVIMMFYVPLLTITYELRIRDIYKNSLLLIFGKILRNIIALVLVGIFTGAVIIGIAFSEGILLYISIALSIILYPVISAYIINSVIAKGVQEAVGYFTGDNAPSSLSQQEQTVLNNTDTKSDYIFVNGRMIKNPNKDNS